MLKNKVILVTGATSGLGAATARVLAGHGAKVMLFGRNEIRAAAVLKSIADVGGVADLILGDITKSSAADGAVAKVLAAPKGRVVEDQRLYTFEGTVVFNVRGFAAFACVGARVAVVIVAIVALFAEFQHAVATDRVTFRRHTRELALQFAPHHGAFVPGQLGAAVLRTVHVGIDGKQNLDTALRLKDRIVPILALCFDLH